MRSMLTNGVVRAAAAAALLAAPFCCAAELAGQETVVRFDPSQTQVTFTLADVLHTVHGVFKLKQGEIRFNPATGAASGSIVIDAASGNSGSNARDSRMHRNILESGKYPDITFTPQHIDGHFSPQGESQVAVEGTFDIHGAGHPLTLTAKVNADKGVVRVDTKFAVPYAQWGMKNPSTLFLRVSDQVDIEIHAVGRIQ